MERRIEKILRPGEKWSSPIARGKKITFTALGDGANLSMLLYNKENTAERYCMADTLKAQHKSYLEKGNVLMSDNGRVLVSVIEDSLLWHDAISGYTTRALTDARYGAAKWQVEQEKWLRCGEENFAIELERYGMGMRDMVPCVNWFSKVICEKSGKMMYVPGHCKSGDHVSLRTDMNVFMLLSNTPNPMDKREHYPSVPIRIEVTDQAAAREDDVCLNYCPENRRAFENTWEYLILTGQE